MHSESGDQLRPRAAAGAAGAGLCRPPGGVAREHVSGLLWILRFLVTNFCYLVSLSLVFVFAVDICCTACCVTPAGLPALPLANERSAIWELT